MPKLSLTIALRTPWSFFIIAHKFPYSKHLHFPQCLLHYLLQRQTSFPIFCLFLQTLLFFLKFLFRATFFVSSLSPQRVVFCPYKKLFNYFFERPQFLPCVQLSATRQRLGPSDFLTPSKITPIWRRL